VVRIHAGEPNCIPLILLEGVGLYRAKPFIFGFESYLGVAPHEDANAVVQECDPRYQWPYQTDF
jgi:hypothetical protein